MISIVEFGSEAIEYIRSELSFSYSKDLAQFLLDLPLENGKVFAYLPAELNREDIPPF